MAEPVYWNLCYDINLPSTGKVKVHTVTWDPDSEMLQVYVSTAEDPIDPEDYTQGVPLYEMNPEEARYELVGMNPIGLGDPPQTLVKDHHVEMAKRLLKEKTDDDA